ncbi:hypothetical protein [Candidatus Phytoplasma fabacearum]|uniref:hypothetical protein n=1 Tax=Candidatus Phytoplasma fabacearum TaxID=2982628 RepID=UPI0027144A3C|nr:hypothetical protein ['Bituminaria bituminosa' little leaf phytoplasma]MDO8030822.1 hypothetical protein ['Bituminaria bituminosa' little leaf phytoplasma]
MKKADNVVTKLRIMKYVGFVFKYPPRTAELHAIKTPAVRFINAIIRLLIVILSSTNEIIIGNELLNPYLGMGRFNIFKIKFFFCGSGGLWRKYIPN